MLCTGIYPCAEGMLRVLKNALEQNGRPSAANGVGDVTPCPALGSGQSCSLLPAVAGGREQPESPPRQGGCPGQPEMQHHQQKVFRGLGYIQLQSVKAAPDKSEAHSSRHRESESASRSVVSDSAAPWTIQSMEFSRPEYWSGWPFPSPGDFPNPEVKPRSPALLW